MTLRQIASRLFMLALAVLGTSTALAQDPAAPYPFEYRTDPVLQVASYYNAITLGEYDRAYSYWENVPDDATLAEFTAGFADTVRVAAYLAAPVREDAGAGNVYAQVPTLLAAEHTDGTAHFYAGCVTVHKTNVPVGDATEPDPNWALRGAAFEEVDAFDLALLDTACELPVDEATFPYSNQYSPIEVLAAYFNAITVHDYARAYGYWETPPDNVTYATFAAGFANTASASMILRADAFIGGAAGSIYASLPVLVTSTLTDGETQHFGGCYITRRSNVPVGDATEPAPEWWLYSADVSAIGDPVILSDGFALLDGVCQTDAVG